MAEISVPLAAVAVMIAAPYGGELWRCARARTP